MEEVFAILGGIVAIGAIAVIGDVRSWRRMVCAGCGSRRLAQVSWIRWNGARSDGKRIGGACRELRCVDCGISLFGESGEPLMTRAQHEAWREARAVASHDRAPPVARIHRRRWW